MKKWNDIIQELEHYNRLLKKSLNTKFPNIYLVSDVKEAKPIKTCGFCKSFCGNDWCFVMDEVKKTRKKL